MGRAGFKIPLRRDPKSLMLNGVELKDVEESKPKTFRWIQGLGLEGLEHFGAEPEASLSRVRCRGWYGPCDPLLRPSLLRQQHAGSRRGP